MCRKLWLLQWIVILDFDNPLKEPHLVALGHKCVKVNLNNIISNFLCIKHKNLNFYHQYIYSNIIYKYNSRMPVSCIKCTLNAYKSSTNLSTNFWSRHYINISDQLIHWLKTIHTHFIKSIRSQIILSIMLKFTLYSNNNNNQLFV